MRVAIARILTTMIVLRYLDPLGQVASEDLTGKAGCRGIFALLGTGVDGPCSCLDVRETQIIPAPKNKHPQAPFRKFVNSLIWNVSH